ncbi:hypothetical protein D3C85_1544230 [compost metagenome]
MLETSRLVRTQPFQTLPHRHRFGEELAEGVARTQGHLFQFSDVPGGQDDTPVVRIVLELVYEFLDLVDFSPHQDTTTTKFVDGFPTGGAILRELDTIVFDDFHLFPMAPLMLVDLR